MSDSFATATPETTAATPTNVLPVRSNEVEVDSPLETLRERGEIAGQRVMRSIRGGSTEAQPDRFAGALGQMSGASQMGMMRQLQRSYGNSYVGRVIQAKLTVGQPGDVYEQEADRIADQVMRMPDRPSSNQELSFSSFHASTAQRKCTACEEEKLQRKENESTVDTPATVPPVVHEVLSSSGQPLDPATRTFMEPRFGQDFSGVRVHTGAKAAESAAAVQARAYTVGNNIVFGGKESPSDLPVLAHELTHVVQQSGDSLLLQRLPGAGGSEANPLGEPAGGCGLCYGEEPGSVGPREAGSAVHRVIQKSMLANVGGIQMEFPWGNGRIDLAVVRNAERRIEIGEIKPANEKGIDDGIDQIESRLLSLPALRQYSGYTVAPLKYPVMKSIRFETGAPVCLEQPGFCYSQSLSVAGPIGGLYLYFCEPSYSELLSTGCKCKCEEQEQEKEPQNKEPGPSDTIPEQLLKLGKELAPELAAVALLDFALAIAGTMVAGTLPLVALATLVLGIVYFWDKFKLLGSKIVGLAQWVWGKFTWILGKLQLLGIKLAELGNWLSTKIAWLAGKLAEGVKWAAGKVAAGAKWVGHKIASAAEAAWDWFFGSDPEPIVPFNDIPVTEETTEETTHCATVAHEDMIIKIGADLLFPFNEWKLKSEADDLLKEAAAKIAPMLQKDDQIIVEGYTDNIGSDEYNQHLSEQRAWAVASWLVEHDVVPMSRIQIEGYGKTRAQYNDPEGRKKDRRVNMWVPKHGSVEEVCW